MIEMYHRNKIHKQGNMIWPQFPAEVLQIITDIGNATIPKTYL